eukprot:SAG31_NODE_927_length_10930_cov_15.134983_4_plen_111_part_00
MPVLKLEQRQHGLSESTKTIGQLLTKVADIVVTTERRNSLSQEESASLAADFQARQDEAERLWNQENEERRARQVIRERELKEKYVATLAIDKSLKAKGEKYFATVEMRR